MKIGVFDSGLGGLAILKEIIKVMPNYDYVYLGDNARVPYGGRSPEIIYQFTKEAVDFLFNKNCKLIILACNSATSTSLRKIQKEYLPKKWPDRKVLGVIRPAVEKIAELDSKKVGIIGTHATINSKSFVLEIKKLSPMTQVFQNPAPLLVPIIEEGEIDWQGTEMILKKYLGLLTTKKIDTLILGCTHYGLMVEKIKKVIGSKIRVVTEGKEVAVKLRKYLNKHKEIEIVLSKKGNKKYYVTDLNERYKKMTELFMNGVLLAYGSSWR